MNITPELVQKFLLHECTPAEADFLVQYFQEHPAEADMYLGEQEWAQFEANGTLPAANDKAIWKEVQRQAFARKGIVRLLSFKRIAAAAAILICAGSATWFLTQQQHSAKQVAMLQQADSTRLATISNASETAQCISLADGSEVTLSSHSVLRYREPFGANDRQLSLSGKALFTVAHNSSKPFSVSANGITTTALGTSFWVDAPADSKKVNVKLISGRIVVQKTEKNTAFKDMYLAPGQEITYDPKYQQAQFTDIAQAMDNKIYHMPAVKTKKADEIVLAFNQTPLADVLKQLQQHYSVNITFDETELVNIKFSGSYGPADNVATILKTIALANDLELEKTPTGYHVTPLK